MINICAFVQAVVAEGLPKTTASLTMGIVVNNVSKTSSIFFKLLAFKFVLFRMADFYFYFLILYFLFVYD